MYANLSNANLSYAHLRNANLRNANLSDAHLSNAHLSYAHLSDIKWNNGTNWSNAIGLHKADNIPEALAQEANFQAAIELSRGYDLAKEGEIDKALPAYQKAQLLDPKLEISPQFWYQLCKYGCLHGYAANVIFAGEKLVKLLPNKEICRDTRGLARALTGDISGAIADFQAVVDSDLFDKRKELKAKRQRWLAALKQGNNPFTPEEMEELRQSEGGN